MNNIYQYEKDLRSYLVDKLEKVAVDTPKIEEPKETTESNTIQKLNDQVEQLQQQNAELQQQLEEATAPETQNKGE